MNELELRIRVQGMTKQWVNDFMINNGVSATIMEDALTKVLVELKDASLQEFLASVSQPTIQEEPSIQVKEDKKEE